MSDLFHEAVPHEWIDKIFAVMALRPQHTFRILTKRPERMRNYVNQQGRRHSIGAAVADILIETERPGRVSELRSEYHFTPLEEGGQAFVTSARNALHLVEGKPLTKGAYQTGATAAGYALGLPISQPAATTKFLWDYTDGDIDPQSLKDWYQGVLTGHIH